MSLFWGRVCLPHWTIPHSPWFLENLLCSQGLRRENDSHHNGHFWTQLAGFTTVPSTQDLLGGGKEAGSLLPTLPAGSPLVSYRIWGWTVNCRGELGILGLPRSLDLAVWSQVSHTRTSVGPGKTSTSSRRLPFGRIQMPELLIQKQQMQIIYGYKVRRGTEEKRIIWGHWFPVRANISLTLSGPQFPHL